MYIYSILTASGCRSETGWTPQSELVGPVVGDIGTVVVTEGSTKIKHHRFIIYFWLLNIILPVEAKSICILILLNESISRQY